MKKIFFFLIILSTITFYGQTHHNKKKHVKEHEKAIVKPDSNKIVVDSVSTNSTSASGDVKNLESNFLWVICGSTAGIVILGLFINSKSKKKKRLLEEARIAGLKNDLTIALKNKEIYEEQYNELNEKVAYLKQSDFLKLFNKAKGVKSHHDYLTSKYSGREVQKMLNHEYWIGMTEEQLIDCKGEPHNIEHEVLKTKTKKIYVYGNKSSGDVFTFVDGALERFKDR